VNFAAPCMASSSSAASWAAMSSFEVASIRAVSRCPKAGKTGAAGSIVSRTVFAMPRTSGSTRLKTGDVCPAMF
jgi:hypothetical protein